MGAKMVDFGGWDMPVEYSGLIAEHIAVRTGVGVFDVSHMGDILIRGPQSLAAVQHISMNDASKLAQGISLILRTTLIGLLISIPSLVAWSYFSKKVEVLAVEMETICANFIRKQYVVTE